MFLEVIDRASTVGKFIGGFFCLDKLSLILGTCSMPSLAEDVLNESKFKSGTGGADNIGFQKIEDGSMISNEHTSKWRIFTDSGRDYFLQGNIKQAEKFFHSALQEAREGFGDRDPHVASACNNLVGLPSEALILLWLSNNGLSHSGLCL
ncbi:hypothetical protein OROHE_005993 [Orobanche hederae]